MKTDASSCHSVSQMGNPYEQDLATYVREYQLSIDELSAALPEIPCFTVNYCSSDYAAFLDTLLPYHQDISAERFHKKKLEMFISYRMLLPGPDAVYMDAAGGGYSYAGTLPCRTAYLQDLEIRGTVKRRVGSRVCYVEASVARMPLPDNSVDAISCHHSIEHFQGSADTEFIREAQRILCPGGRLVIVPIFISRVHREITNKEEFSNWGVSMEKRVYDPNATLPGRYSGNFARVYDPDCFRDRILKGIDRNLVDVSIMEPRLDGRPIPDPLAKSNRRISKFNFPYRVLKITKKAGKALRHSTSSDVDGHEPAVALPFVQPAHAVEQVQAENDR